MIFFPATSWLTAEVDFYTIEVKNTSTHFLLLSIYLYIQSKGRRLETISNSWYVSLQRHLLCILFHLIIITHFSFSLISNEQIFSGSSYFI